MMRMRRRNRQMPLTLAVGRTPSLRAAEWSAADALVGLLRVYADFYSIGKSGTRASRADRGVRPTRYAESQSKRHWGKAPAPRRRKPRRYDSELRKWRAYVHG